MPPIRNHTTHERRPILTAREPLIILGAIVGG